MENNNILSTNLFKSVETVNVIETKKLLKEGAYVNTKDNYGYTPLHYSVLYHPNIEIINLLIEYGADLNVQNKIEIPQTPFNIAIESNCRLFFKDFKDDFWFNVIKVFLKQKNININQKNFWMGYTLAEKNIENFDKLKMNI